MSRFVPLQKMSRSKKCLSAGKKRDIAPTPNGPQYNAIGILSLIILNISKRQQYLYRWWTVSKLFLLNNGLLCSNS